MSRIQDGRSPSPELSRRPGAATEPAASTATPDATIASAASDAQVKPADDPFAVDEFELQQLRRELLDPPIPRGRVARPQYYRTMPEIEAAVRELAAKYPGLVQLEDIGDSWEKKSGKTGRDILVLRIGNGAKPGPKPKALFVGGTHARETANPQYLLRWTEQMLQNYGKDPEATALLDDQETAICFVLNPDGRAIVDRGYETGSSSMLMQRTNANKVDLNRNCDTHFGASGTSTHPGDSTYGGTGPASEPETQAYQAFVQRYRPNLFIDFHSHGRMVLFPWGWTSKPAPDETNLEAVARRLAGIAKYRAMQASDLYPASGGTDDYAYEKVGIPAFTFETGSGFQPSDSDFEKNWAELGPAITYAARIARDVYQMAKGPEATRLTLSASQVVADVSDAAAGGKTIAAAEVVFDPAVPVGEGIPLQATDGAFDEPTEQVAGALPAQTPAGAKLAYVRAEDADGNWGPTTAQWIPEAAEPAQVLAERKPEPAAPARRR